MALTAGTFGHAEGWLAVIAGIVGPQGPALAVFNQDANGLSRTAKICPLSAKATALVPVCLTTIPISISASQPAMKSSLFTDRSRPRQSVMASQSISRHAWSTSIWVSTRAAWRQARFSGRSAAHGSRGAFI